MYSGSGGRNELSSPTHPHQPLFPVNDHGGTEGFGALSVSVVNNQVQRARCRSVQATGSGAFRGTRTSGGMPLAFNPPAGSVFEAAIIG